MAILQDKVMNYLLGLIEQNPHNTVLPSQNDLRRKFDCSTITVRKVLEKLEERGLIYRVQGKGSFVRRPEQNKAQVRIFLIISPKTDLRGDFISSLVTASRNHSYHTLFYCYDDNEAMLFYELDRVAPQVVLWLAPSIYKHDKTLQKLRAHAPHVILFNRQYDHPSISYVSGDFASDGRAMGEKLLQHSVREVLFVSLNMKIMYSYLRATGLSEVITAAGGNVTVIDAAELPNFKDDVQDNPGQCEEALCGAIVGALAQKRYSAIVGAQGHLWSTIQKACSRSSIDPRNFYLGNFNAPAGNLKIDFPQIVVEQPIAAMAEEAIRLAARLLNGGSPEQMLFGSQFVGAD